MNCYFTKGLIYTHNHDLEKFTSLVSSLDHGILCKAVHLEHDILFLMGGNYTDTHTHTHVCVCIHIGKYIYFLFYFYSHLHLLMGQHVCILLWQNLGDYQALYMFEHGRFHFTFLSSFILLTWSHLFFDALV